MDHIYSAPNALISPSAKLASMVQVAVGFFVYWLEIHPYANGNGHLARLVLITLLALFGVYLSRWPLHPRPADPPYSELISRYRKGDQNALIRFVLSCI
jgi:hypothetical protein